MVSRFGHCLNDLLYRWKIGALPIDTAGVVSNHFDYHKVSSITTFLSTTSV
jgi:formyltetrahydrofolate deformylase